MFFYKELSHQHKKSRRPPCFALCPELKTSQIFACDVEDVRQSCEQARFMNPHGVGVLSLDPVTNLKYHFVVTTTIITRMCRQYGMEPEQAFRLNDFYIRKLNGLHIEQDVCRLHDKMVIDYAEKMRKHHRGSSNSWHINACKAYIYSHIKERITVEDRANAPGVSPSYLSRLFKKRPASRLAPTFTAEGLTWSKICCASATIP